MTLNEIEVGMWVTVRHIGLLKLGRVEKVGRTRAHVRVPVYGGKAHKTIIVPIADLGAR